MEDQVLKISGGEGRLFDAHVWGAEDGAQRPGIVLLQEIFGVNANIRAVARLLSEAGFLVAAPDLFWRMEPGLDLDPADPVAREQAMGFNSSFDSETGLADAAAVASTLRGHPACSGRVGAVGYCLGGRLAFVLAERRTVDAAVAFYPVAIKADLDAGLPQGGPLLVHLGAEDPLCPPPTQAAIRSHVDAPGRSVVVYDGLGHGFARLGRSGAAEQAAQQAEAASVRFLHEALGQQEPRAPVS